MTAVILRKNQATVDPGNAQSDIVGWNVENLGAWAVGYVFEFGSLHIQQLNCSRHRQKW